MTALESWLVWKERCALSLCPAETKAELIEFAGHRFDHYMRTYGTGTRKGSLLTGSPPARDAWHLFETYLQLRDTREGKTYKEWLTARTDRSDAPALVESGATLIIRSAVRDYLRSEGPRRSTESLDAELHHGADGGSLTLLDLLPTEFNAVDEVERREHDVLVDELVEMAFGALGFRERVALLARELGIAISSPVATEAAGCAKSMLSVAFRTALEQIADTVRACCPGEDRHTLAMLAVSVFGVICQRLRKWGRSETRCTFLFNREKHTGQSGEEK